MTIACDNVSARYSFARISSEDLTINISSRGE